MLTKGLSFDDNEKLILLLDLKAKLTFESYDRLGLKELYHIRAEVENEIQKLTGGKKKK